LKDYRGMSIGPSRGAALVLKGIFAFSATHKSGGKITDSYQLEITVPAEFPKLLPTARETGGKFHAMESIM